MNGIVPDAGWGGGKGNSQRVKDRPQAIGCILIWKSGVEVEVPVTTNLYGSNL